MRKPAIPLRTIILLAVVGLLLGEAFTGVGIVHRMKSLMATAPRTLVARVAGHPITRSQLDRAVSANLWLEGRSHEKLTPAELESARKAALDDLIDESLLRLQVKALTAQLAVSDDEIDTRFKRFSGRFESKAELESAMTAQGIADEKSLRDRLAAQIRQEKYIELRITPAIRTTDEEALEWFGKNPDSVSLPERVEARHVFIPTLDHPPEEAKQKLDAALADLTAKKKDFATLASELSGDPATKDSGGNLGWMTRDRLPADFSAPLFSLETGKPALVRSLLGWHLVEVTARKPAGPRGFDQAKAEILAALEATKRRQAIEDLRKSLRKLAAGKIEIL